MVKSIVYLTMISLYSINEARSIVIMLIMLWKVRYVRKLFALLCVLLVAVTVFSGCVSGVSAAQNVKAGDRLEFGGYNWIVLDVQNGHALILSEMVINYKPLSSNLKATTWETSDIRNWLNNDFYNTITRADQSRIVETSVINDDNQWFDTKGGNNTADKIFLLSIDEVLLYFGGGEQWDNETSGGDLGEGNGTDYAGIVGLWDERNHERTAYDNDGNERWWMLRSPGQREGNFANIGVDGDINLVGGSLYGRIGVRPALWLVLSNVN